MDREPSRLVLQRRIDLRGISPLLGTRLRYCEQVVLFGSRAVALGTPSSDWDLLCVSTRGPLAIQRSRTVLNVDLVWASPLRLESDAWLGSELAGHIAKYGVWVRGAGNWIEGVRRSKAAISRKADLIRSRLEALERHSGLMSPLYRRRFYLLIRRDLQRLRYLQEGVAVPPSPLLDDEWRTVPEMHSWVASRATTLTYRTDIRHLVESCLAAV